MIGIFTRMMSFLLRNWKTEAVIAFGALVMGFVAWRFPQLAAGPPPRFPASTAPRLPNRLDLVIFDACSDPGAVMEFSRLLQDACPQVHIEIEAFDSRWEMPHTRIYPRHDWNQDDAVVLEKWLPGDQQIVPYDRQSKTPLEDRPAGRPGGRYADMRFSEQRHLGIFLGNDYPAILEKLRGIH